MQIIWKLFENWPILHQNLNIPTDILCRRSQARKSVLGEILREKIEKLHKNNICRKKSYIMIAVVEFKFWLPKYVYISHMYVMISIIILKNMQFFPFNLGFFDTFLNFFKSPFYLKISDAWILRWNYHKK